MGQLLPVAQRLTNPSLSAYLRVVEVSHPELVQSVRAELPNSYLLEGLLPEAIAAYDTNIQRYPNSDLERTALYGKFVLVLYNNGDTTQARTLYTALRTTYPSSAERYLAEIQLAHYRSSQSGGTMRAMQGIEKTAKAQMSSTSSKLPTEFAILQNYPNPFNPSMLIRYQLPEDAFVTLKVFDVLGRDVSTLVNEFKKVGYHNADFDASKLSSGIYFYKIAAGNYVSVKKLVILK